MTDPSDHLAAEARRRTREQVQEIFARPREVPERRCPHCGEIARTEYEHCPACGRSYFAKPARFSRRTRRTLQAAGALAFAAIGAVVVLMLAGEAHRNKASSRERQAAAVTAKRRQLAAEQRPHHAVVTPRDRGDRGTRLRRRQTLVRRLEAAITSDARGRVARGAATPWSTARAATSSTCASRLAVTRARPRSVPRRTDP